MKKIFLVMFSLLICAGGIYGLWRHNYRDTRKDILIITIDTLRADRLGCYGYSRKITPSLDEFAKQCYLFENAFTTMPTTAPAHASIFFGTWPRVHGSTSNFKSVSNSNLTSLPAILKTAGYQATAFVSNFSLGRTFEKIGGFDNIHFPEKTSDAEETLGLAADWIQNKRKKDQNFFLWIHLWDPHWPYDLHPEFMNKINPRFQLDFEKKNEFHKPGYYTPPMAQAMIDLYDNEVAYTDYYLGRFLRKLEAQHLFQNTILFVTADHGETLDELTKTANYAFDHGEFLYDHQLHIPLLVRFPEAAEKGKRIRTAVSLVDIMPTILQASGLKIPATAVGKSLLPFLRGDAPPHSTALVFFERRDFDHPPRPFLANRQYGVREGDYKLLYTESTEDREILRNGSETIRPEGVPANIAKLLENRMKEWLKITELASPEKEQTVSEEEAESLRSLGYVQ